MKEKEFLNAKIKYLRGKCAYPYECVDSYDQFNNTELPPKKTFYSLLNANIRGKRNGDTSDENYDHAQNIWKIFSFQTFKDYYNHYLKKDVLFLADLFENFIDISLNFYKLEPCNYYSLRK